MPLFVGRNPETNEECDIELRYTDSIEDAKTQICDRLGVEPKKYHLVYKDELLLYQKSLQELNLKNDSKPVFCLSRVIKSTKPLNAFSLLGLPGFGSGPDTDAETESESRIPRPLSKYTETGMLDDPRNFSISKNSSFAYRVHTMTRDDYTQEDSEKLMDNITSEIQKIVDNLSYDELDQLATECLRIDNVRMETLRDQYYDSYRTQTS